MSSSIVIHKSAHGETVHVSFGNGISKNSTSIILDNVTKYNKDQFLGALMKWALDGYKGNPPVLNR